MLRSDCVLLCVSLSSYMHTARVIMLLSADMPKYTYRYRARTQNLKEREVKKGWHLFVMCSKTAITLRSRSPSQLGIRSRTCKLQRLGSLSRSLGRFLTAPNRPKACA